MKKKWLIVIIVVLLLAGIGIRSWLKNKQPEYLFEKVKKVDLLQTVAASGEIRAQDQVTLKFQTSGLMTWVGVKEGDWVKKGQALAQLDKRELQKNLEKELRDYSQERNDFEEEYRVTYREQTPQTALTDTVKRILEKNQWDLDKAVLDVELKDIALKFATLTTPIEGIVIEIDMPLAGINITPATATFTVANPKIMLFEAEIDEVDVARIKLGQKAIINLDAYPDKPIEGEVNYLAFAAIGTSGGGTAYPTQVILPNNESLSFRIGMNGDIEIVTDQKENVLAIPIEALQYQEGKTLVRVWENNKVKQVEVKTGLETDTEVEIVAGLSEGQEIITGEKRPNRR